MQKHIYFRKSEAKVIFDFEKTENEFGYGKICSTVYDKDETYTIKIEAEEGDYITVGSHIIDDEIGKELKVNNLEIMALLTSDNKEICFPIKNNEDLTVEDVLRLNGNVYTKKDISYYKLNEEKYKDIANRVIEDGLIQGLIYPFGKAKKEFCISHTIPKKTDLIFSIQLTSPKLSDFNQFIYPPHLPGVIYTYYFLKENWQ